MQLKFNADLPFQRAAIDAVVDLFEGQPLADSGLTVSFNAGPLLPSEYGLGNNLVLGHDAIFANLQRIQERNDIAKTGVLPAYNFSVEMETGTGKTYVYLRTAFELNLRYGFTKFVIVVPSIAIREGALHSLETMREHFRSLYDGVAFDHFVYDSRQIGRLRSFATSNALQIMVINIQAFQRDVQGDEGEAGAGGPGNVIYRELDRLSGHRPIDFLRATRPVVIIDEPQKMTGAASAAAINRLDPLCTLRYSATYDASPKLYRLGPIEALDQKLVKRIEVAGVVEDENLNAAFVRLLSVDIARRNAQVEINAATGTGGGAKQKKVAVKHGDDLFVKSGDREEYRDGFLVREISFEIGNQFVEFGNGRRIEVGQTSGGLTDEILREQISWTVREHLDKELRLRPRGIKVLSLFFIDRVANYRDWGADGASRSLGKLGVWFEQEYLRLSADPKYRALVFDPVASVHDGYFSQDKKGGRLDTTGVTQADEGAYNLIMRDKERLLTLDEPLRFSSPTPRCARAGTTRTSSRSARCASSAPCPSAAR